MKKAITILAVLIVLASAVFAAETHKIQIKSEVEEVKPVFQLIYISGGEGSATTNTTDGGAEFEDPESYVIDDAITVADISQEPITVVFDANLVTDVKLKEAAIYDLQFVANPLKGAETNYEVSPILSGSTVTYDDNTAERTTQASTYYNQHETYGTFVSEKTALAVEASTEAAGEGAPYSQKLTQTTKVIFGTENVTHGTLGRFTVVYPQDTSAAADVYTAYIELNITVES